MSPAPERPHRSGDPAQDIGPMVFVASLERPELDDADRRHLERVLRLRPGAAMVVCDGEGRWRPARLGAEVEPDGEVVEVAAPARPVTVGFALAKGDRPELVVQKLTELGVDRIEPMLTEHCVVRWDPARAERHHERLVAVARAAAMQCRRTRLPLVAEVGSLPAAGPGIARCDAGGAPPSADVHTLLVGPEGGWSPAEREQQPDAVRLGAHVLRAETAAIVAGTVLTSIRDGLLSPTGELRPI